MVLGHDLERDRHLGRIAQLRRVGARRGQDRPGGRALGAVLHFPTQRRELVSQRIGPVPVPGLTRAGALVDQTTDIVREGGGGHERKYSWGWPEGTGRAESTTTLLSDHESHLPHLPGADTSHQPCPHEVQTQPMMTNEVGKLLTASEVAEMLHLHVNTVKRLGDRGELPFFRVCKRGDRRFRYDDVVEFLRRAK